MASIPRQMPGTGRGGKGSIDIVFVCLSVDVLNYDDIIGKKME
jgi:hypothetical protein